MWLSSKIPEILQTKPLQSPSQHTSAKVVRSLNVAKRRREENKESDMSADALNIGEKLRGHDLQVPWTNVLFYSSLATVAVGGVLIVCF